MTEEDAGELITQRFVDRWPIETAAVAGAWSPPLDEVPSVLPNKVPSDPALIAAATTLAYVQLKFLPYQRQPLSQGNNPDYRQWKWVVVLIFVRENTGSKLGSQLATRARNVFEGQTLTLGSDELTIGAGMPRAAGALSGYDVTAIQCPAYWYESRRV